MKTRHNTINLLAMGMLLLGLFSACTKDKINDGNNNVSGGTGRGFRATAEGDGSKTYLDGSAVKWEEGDMISVRNNAVATEDFSLEEGANTQYGSFNSAEAGDDFFTPNYTAIYPTVSTAGTDNAIASATTATFDLPAVQAYKANSFGVKAMPMMAHSTDEDLEFKNVLGGVVFPLTYTHNLENCNYLVKRVVVTSNNADDVLWGTCTTTIIGLDGAANLSSSVTNSATDKHIITLDCSADGGVALIKDTPIDFTVMVPAGTLESGFTLTVFGDMIYNGETFANEELYTQSVWWDSGHDDFIVRSRLSKVKTALEIKMVGYTVKYLDIGTELELAPSKIVKGFLGETKVEEALPIDGYVLLSVDFQTLTLAAENFENVITFYYEEQPQQVLTTVTVHCMNRENLEIIHEDIIYEDVPVGITMEVLAPEIDGYTPIRPSLTFEVVSNMIQIFLYYPEPGPDMSAD
ncbi:MAG: MucBP domain-containing protein [Bacteroidales bacterium]|nr:MucBP domain-containing protein [Bacteroidales bacterium]